MRFSARPHTLWLAALLMLLTLVLAAGLAIALGAKRSSPAARGVAIHTRGLEPLNSSRQLDVRFAPSGVRIDSRGAALGLRLRAAGYGSSLRAVGGASLRVTGDKALYERAGLEEWFVNGPLGLEQGFTLERALPAGGTGALTLAMSLSGDVHASIAGNGQSIALRGPRGSSLRYGALRATDARGRSLHAWLGLDGQTIVLRVDTAGARYPIRIDPLIQSPSATLSGGSEAEESLFGYSVALSADGNTALVGGRRASGAAWVFTRSGSNWTQQGPPLTVEEEEESTEACAKEAGECEFGRRVALSGDGNTALIGGPADDSNRGAVWVFTRSGSTWTQTGKLTGGGDESAEGHFGRSVALSADGDTALVSATKNHSSRGAVWVFTLAGSTWTQQGSVLTGGEEEIGLAHFGSSVALSESGDTALIGGRMDDGGVGGVWVFTRSGESWAQQGSKLTGAGESGEGRFGSSVALSSFGDTALVGGRTDAGGVGAAWVFTRSGSTWTQQGPKLTGGEDQGEGEFGADVALSANGETALVGGPFDASVGAAWLFTRSGATWKQQGTKLASPEASSPQRFGTSVALSAEGRTALIGGPAHRHEEGAAWVFRNTSVSPPTVTSVSPESGSSEGGTPVRVTGSGFVPGTTVEIGGAASSVEVLSETELTAITSTHAVGPEQVLVSTPEGESTDGPTYTYVLTVAPSVSSIIPTSGSSEGGTLVTIRGSGFLSGSTTVDIGAAASSVHVLSETGLTAVTPAHAPGREEVVVGTPNGETTSGPTYEYLSAPPVTSVTPVVTPSLAGVPSGSLGALSFESTQLPRPQLGVTGNLTPVSGKVLVKLPGSNKFVLLSVARQVPFGTIVDAREGKVTLTAVGPHDQLQAMTFYEGEFKITQKRNARVFATLRGGDFAVCPTKRERGHLARAYAASSGKHVVRKLWASGHGSYSTKGNYAAGAVLGTRWLTEDLCDGTYIHVATDSVEVTNLVTHRRFRVKAGHSYFAKAP